MNLSLSWDIALIAFAGIVLTYNLIIGKHQSVRVIIGTYISIIASQGIGNVIQRLAPTSIRTFVLIPGVGMNISVIGIVKIVLLLALVIGFAIRSGIEINYAKQTGTTMSMILSALFGLATAGLLAAGILTFATGGGILDGQAVRWSQLAPIASGSQLLLLLVLNREIFFTLPALLILAAGFLHKD